MENVIRSDEQTSSMLNKTVLVNARLKSGDELARALIEGEVFWSENTKVWFDSEMPNPFRYGNAPLLELWGSFAKLTKEVSVLELTLEQKLSAGLSVQAFVSQIDPILGDSARRLLYIGTPIRILVEIVEGGFFDKEGRGWKFAREVEVRFVGVG